MLRVRDAAESDISAIEALHQHAWGGSVVVGHGVAYDLRTLPALACVDDAGEVVGALALHRDGDALRFDQRRGLRVVGVDGGAVDRARLLKPTIPVVGAHGVELHDELILEWEAGT